MTLIFYTYYRAVNSLNKYLISASYKILIKYNTFDNSNWCILAFLMSFKNTFLGKIIINAQYSALH